MEKISIKKLGIDQCLQKKAATFRVLQRRKNGRLKDNAELVVRWGIYDI